MTFNPDAKYLSGYKDKARRYEYKKQYSKTHPRKHWKNYPKNWHKYRQKLKAIVLEKLGGIKCVKCGITDIRILTINHKNGGGTAERKESKGYQFYRKIASGKRDIQDLEVRCYNCNILYEYERGRLKEYIVPSSSLVKDAAL